MIDYRLVFLMTVLGAISSGVGGILGSLINNKYIRAISYEITAGLMTGIVCFEMLPESFYIGSVTLGVIGAIIGIAGVLLLDITIEKLKTNKKSTSIKKNKYKYSAMSLVIMISMAAHNLLEGVAIGAGMSYSTAIGISLIISIFIHDIPEGMVVGFTSIKNNIDKIKVIVNSITIGMYVGIGVLIGEVVGGISDTYVSISLSIAAGAMLYIVACDLIPSSKEIANKKIISIMYIIGIISSIFMTKFLQ